MNVNAINPPQSAKNVFIRRSRSRRSYTQIDNYLINDFSISPLSYRIITYVMSLPEDWKIHISHLAKQTKKNERTIYRCMNELIQHGYVKRTVHRNELGQIISWNYEASDYPEFLMAEGFYDHEHPVDKNVQVDDFSKVHADQSVTKDEPVDISLHVAPVSHIQINNRSQISIKNTNTTFPVDNFVDKKLLACGAASMIKKEKKALEKLGNRTHLYLKLKEIQGLSQNTIKLILSDYQDYEILNALDSIKRQKCKIYKTEAAYLMGTLIRLSETRNAS